MGGASPTNEITDGAIVPCFAPIPFGERLFAPGREWNRVATGDRLSLKQKTAFFRKLGLIDSQTTSIDSHSII